LLSTCADVDNEVIKCEERGVLSHLETLVHSCGNCEQTLKNATDDCYGCVHDKETHKVTRKLPDFRLLREKLTYEHRGVNHANDNRSANASLL
jgi:hypothetical protein